MIDKLLDPLELASLVAGSENDVSSSSGELLRVFAEDGKSIGLAPRLLCHRLGLLHKVAFCFFSAPDSRLLLQKRKGGRLDVAVGGHLNRQDNSAEDAIIREIHEEIGILLNPNRLTKIAEYQRHSSDRLSKPREVNNEFRVLFLHEFSKAEVQNLDRHFSNRKDQKAVLSIQWFTLKEVLSACDSGKTADGLLASIPYYLLWLVNRRPT
ncbi:hypothetical protein CEE37_09480 [candidate division LCP-89 bacterium B3_LCP]|uniref:Nudix hydrolase domain-containing protein n=1 Tax=candidate division LCP-89 bacterium B3_LCP TaxID=2012998 RepID=A0A532UYC6_UNCL8|nr:MAG: hypothetical protein CEE37_09480 [candidate division LCP-89 bacterium B3_LCP]